MITAGDFRNGVTFDDNGQVFQVIEFLHVKPGKGAAFVRAEVEKCDYRRSAGTHLQPHRQV